MDTLRQLRQSRDGAVVRKGELAVVRFALYADIAVFCADEPKKTARQFFSIIFAHFICCEAVVLIFWRSHRRHNQTFFKVSEPTGNSEIKSFILLYPPWNVFSAACMCTAPNIMVPRGVSSCRSLADDKQGQRDQRNTKTGQEHCAQAKGLGQISRIQHSDGASEK